MLPTNRFVGALLKANTVNNKRIRSPYSQGLGM